MDRTFAEISLDKLIANFQAVRRTVGEGVEVLAVVKADAYGHGAVEVARALERAGARWFGVTSSEEGILLRQNGVRGRLLVMADMDRAKHDALAEYDLTLLLHSIEQVQHLETWARRRGSCARVHLKFDSGMGRLGLEDGRAADAIAVLARSPFLRLEGLATHLASAEDLESGQTAGQLRRFRGVLEQFAQSGLRAPLVHLANSAALVYCPETWGTMVRPGLALYGYVTPPRGAVQAPFLPAPVLSWKARVILIKEFGPGAPLGYNASYRTERRMRVGVVAAGYADGLSRRLSNGGPMLAAGKRVSIVGLVSMDVTLIDLTTAPELKPGDCVTLLGQDGGETLDAFELACRCDTIPYEVLCGIGKRVPRVYR